MQVIVKKAMVDSLVSKLVKEERSFHSRNVSELEKAAPPIFPQSEMAQQLSTSKMPVEDNEFVPTNLDELGKATMQLSRKVEDEMIEKFYTNFKTLVKKFEAMNEARLPSLQGEPVEEPTSKSRAERRAARRAELLGASEPETPYIPSTPAEDAADIAASITPPTTRPDPERRPRQKKSPRAEPTTKSARAALRTPASGEYDPVAEYLKSLYEPRPRPDWLKNVTMNLSDMAVGDANKLLAAIIKKMGEENVTVENLEAAAMNAIDSLTYSIDGNNIVITAPAYKVKFTYNTEGNPQNLFSLEQYKEILRGLTSQSSGGAGSQESWGPKYAAAIKDLTYARNDRELETAMLEDLPKIQEALTDAVLDSYPAGTEEFNAKEVADKLDIAKDQVVDAFIQSGLRSGTNTVTENIFGKQVELSIFIPETPGAMQAIEDARFGNVLSKLLSATPDELRAYVGKKRRKLRSAVKMSRSEENYFYSLGMKLGGSKFKMSAEEFRNSLARALDWREENAPDMSDEDLVNKILVLGDVISKEQIEKLVAVQDVICSAFKSIVIDSPVFEKKIKDGDLIPDVATFDQVPANMREVYRDFMERFIMAYTDKDNIGAGGFEDLDDLAREDAEDLFDIYDAATADRSNFSGVVATHIYGDPGAGRRARDLSNFVGNLRHVSRFLDQKSKEMSKMGRTIAAGHLKTNADMLVDPDFVVASINNFLNQVGSLPEDVEKQLIKAGNEAATEIAKILASPAPAPRVPRAPVKAEPSADIPALSPAPDVKITPADPAAINKTYDDIIASFNAAPEGVKDAMLDDFEEASDPDGAGPSSRQLAKYPALTTAADYAELVNKLTQLKESTSRSLLLNLIHGYTRG